MQQGVKKTTTEKLIEAESIMKEIRVMRSLQKEYFKERSTDVLQRSKIQEKKVDLMIEEYYAPQQQGKLF